MSVEWVVAKKCPSCGGGLVWGGQTPFDRREARCTGCGAAFTRKVGWAEASAIGVMIYVVFKVADGLAFRWFNPFGLAESGRELASSITILGGLGIAIVLASKLTRRGRRLVRVDDCAPTTEPT